MSDIQYRVNEEVFSAEPGFFKRLLWVFTSPGKLMESLSRRPRVLFGLIAGSLASEILYIVRLPLYKDMLRSTSLAQQNLYSAYGFEMTPEMVEATLPTTVRAGLIGIPLSMLFGLLFIAFIFFAILKLTGGQGKFKAYLSVTVYANLIRVLYTLLLIPISFITESLHSEVSLTSLASLASVDMEGTVLYRVLAGIDIISIWYYAVMAIGFTAVSKLKKKYVYGVTAGIFLIGMVIGIAGTIAVKKLM